MRQPTLVPVHDIRLPADFLQRLIRADLVGALGAAAGQHQPLDLVAHGMLLPREFAFTLNIITL